MSPACASTIPTAAQGATRMRAAKSLLCEGLLGVQNRPICCFLLACNLLEGSPQTYCKSFASFCEFFTVLYPGTIRIHFQSWKNITQNIIPFKYVVE